MEKIKALLPIVKDRLKSPVTWMSLGALVFAKLVSVGIVDVEFATHANSTIEGICYFLGLVGILNNPSDKVKF